MDNLYKIRYTNSITSWDDALPLGNGKLGLLVYGNGPLIFTLDRVDLWDDRMNPALQNPKYNYENLIRYSTEPSEEAWAKRADLFENSYGVPYPSKITAGRLVLDFHRSSETVVSELNMKTGIADIVLDENASAEVFVSYSDLVGVAKVDGDFDVSVVLPDYISREGKGGLAYPPATVRREGDFLYYTQNTYTDFSYGIVCLMKKTGSSHELYFSIATSGDSKDFIRAEKEKLSAAASVGYEALKKKQIAHWKRFWQKSSAFTGDDALDRVYIQSQYLFGASSRRGCYPVPLQGVWTADDGELPPWKGDYHFDTNVQLSYMSYLRSNHITEGRVLIDYLWSMRKEYRRFAKSFFGVKGLLIPGCTTISGISIVGWAQYSLSPTNTIWTIKVFDDHYRYTDDLNFLKKRAYPVFCEVGDAFLGLLREKNGKLYLPLSSSPEIYDNRRESYLEPNSNFDLSLMRYLFETLCDYGKRLGTDCSRFAAALSKLDDLAVSDDGIFMLDKNQKLRGSHRHFSHLMSLYPLCRIGYEGHEKLYADNLAELERLGTFYWVGFSFVWAGALCAMGKNGAEAERYLHQFCDGFVNTNGFHLNGDFKRIGYSNFHYRPFTLEANFAFCDAVHQMMLQDYSGTIELFPAVPKDLASMRFSGLRAINGLLVSASMKNGKVNKIVIRSPKEQTVSLSYNGEKKNVALLRGVNRIV